MSQHEAPESQHSTWGNTPPVCTDSDADDEFESASACVSDSSAAPMSSLADLRARLPPLPGPPSGTASLLTEQARPTAHMKCVAAVSGAVLQGITRGATGAGGEGIGTEAGPAPFSAGPSGHKGEAPRSPTPVSKMYPPLPTLMPQTWSASGLPHSSSPATPPQSPSTQKPALTDEVRAVIAENRRKALEKRAAAQAAANNQDRQAAARAFGQASLASYGITSTSGGPFRSLRRPKQDFRVPVAKDEAARAKLEKARQEYQEKMQAIKAPFHTRVLGLEEPMAMEEEPIPSEPFVPDPRCSEEQLKVLDEVKDGRNVFFSGSAGVGKSFMLNEIVRMLEHMSRAVAVTAPTGIAAINISGTTFHAFARVGLGHESVHGLYNTINGRCKKAKRHAALTGTEPPADLLMATIDVLVIDEVSMLPPDLFDKVNLLMQAFRGDERPFGGAQLVLSGDFFQLPCVQKDDDIVCPYCGCKGFERDRDARTLKCVLPINKQWNHEPCGRVRREYRYCFETPTWRQLGLSIMQFARVFRQSDEVFIRALNKIRRGEVDEDTDKLFRARAKPLAGHEIKPTSLYPKKRDVAQENQLEFSKLADEATPFQATDIVRGAYAQTFVKRLDQDVQAPKRLDLKIGTQVLLLANINIEIGLVNGSRGVVIDWHDSSDPNSHPGAISGSAPARRQQDEEWRKKADEAWTESQSHKALPLVLFANGLTVIIRPHTWSIDIDDANYVARTQLPLGQAWALTTHKCQGSSLDRVKVNLYGVFEAGQAYVALSRARTLEGLQVTGWDRKVVRADPLVIAFYDALSAGKDYGDPSEPFLQLSDFFAPMVLHQITGGRPRLGANALHGTAAEIVRPPGATTFASQPMFTSQQRAPAAAPPLFRFPGPSATPAEIVAALAQSTSRSNGGPLTPAPTAMPDPASPGTANVAAALRRYQDGLQALLQNLRSEIEGQGGWDVQALAMHAKETALHVFGRGAASTPLVDDQGSVAQKHQYGWQKHKAVAKARKAAREMSAPSPASTPRGGFHICSNGKPGSLTDVDAGGSGTVVDGTEKRHKKKRRRGQTVKLEG